MGVLTGKDLILHTCKDSLYKYIPSGSLMVSDVNTDSGGVVVSFDVLLLRRLLSAKQL